VYCFFSSLLLNVALKLRLKTGQLRASSAGEFFMLILFWYSFLVYCKIIVGQWLQKISTNQLRSRLRICAGILNRFRRQPCFSQPLKTWTQLNTFSLSARNGQLEGRNFKKAQFSRTGPTRYYWLVSLVSFLGLWTALSFSSRSSLVCRSRQIECDGVCTILDKNRSGEDNCLSRPGSSSMRPLRKLAASMRLRAS